MREPVLFPDAAAALLSHLNTQTGVSTAGTVPAARKVGDGALFVARRVGGVSADVVIDRATIVLESWHDTEAAAHDLAQLGRAHLLALYGTTVDDVLIYRVAEASAPASLPDTLQRSPRYTATYVPDVRGSTLVESS